MQTAATPTIGLFYGSTNGNTAAVAAQIADVCSQTYGVAVERLDIAEYYLEEMLAFSYLILGVPTWNMGQLQRDWDEVMEEFEHLDLSGKRVAVFGLGDQVSYPDTFGDALLFVADKAEACGATMYGAWPTDGYTFRQSWAVRGGRFVGLMLDEDNQPEQTPSRVAAWLQQVMAEFGFTTPQHLRMDSRNT